MQDRVAVLWGAVSPDGFEFPVGAVASLESEPVAPGQVRIGVELQAEGVLCTRQFEGEVTHYLLSDGRGGASDYGVYGLHGPKNGIAVPWPEVGDRGWEARTAAEGLAHQLALASAGPSALRLVREHARMFLGSPDEPDPRRRIVLVIRASSARRALPALTQDVSCLLVVLEVAGE